MEDGERGGGGCGGRRTSSAAKFKVNNNVQLKPAALRPFQNDRAIEILAGTRSDGARGTVCYSEP